MRKWTWLAGVLVATIVMVGALVASARVQARYRERDAMAQLGHRYAVLRDSLRHMAAGDSLLQRIAAGNPGIAVALDESLLVDLLEDGAHRYLDGIEVDLEADFGGHGEGDLEAGTPFGQMTLGDWRVLVTVHEMKGRLATERPTVAVSGSNRLDLSIPVRITGGRGAVTLDFEWNSKGIINLLCKDWKARATLAGEILPRHYTVRGALVLDESTRGVVADPDFPRDRFPLSMELDDESWKRIRALLEEQNKLYRCGLLVKPDSQLVKLRAMGLRGLRFRLPAALFRPIALPANLSETVSILRSPVDIEVTTDTLRVEPGLLWYAADVEVRRSTRPGARLPLPSDR